MVIIDGVQKECLGRPVFRFSPDGDHYVIVGEDVLNIVTVFDGREFKRRRPMNNMSGPVISHDCGRVGFLGDGTGFLRDRRAGEPPRAVGLILKSDGGLDYLGDVNGQYAQLVGTDVSWSPDCKRLAFIASEGAGQMMVIDGRPGKRYRDVSGTVHTFSPDGQHFAYVGDGTVVLDGVEQVLPGKGPGKIWRTVFSPDSRHLAYSGEWNHTPLLVLDGAAIDESADLPRESTDLLFSPDSARLAFSTGRSVFVNGKEGKQYNAYIDPAYLRLQPGR